MDLGNIVSLFGGKSEEGPGMFEQIKLAGEGFVKMQKDFDAVQAKTDSMDIKLDAILSILMEAKNVGSDRNP